MSTKGEQTIIDEDGVKKDAVQITFTNGSLQQLKDLAPFVKVNEPSQVVEKAIGILQQLKDLQEKENKGTPLG